MRLIISLYLLFTTSIIADFREGGVEGAGGTGSRVEGEGRRDATWPSPPPSTGRGNPILHPPPWAAGSPPFRDSRKPEGCPVRLWKMGGRKAGNGSAAGLCVPTLLLWGRGAEPFVTLFPFLSRSLFFPIKKPRKHFCSRERCAFCFFFL